MDGAVYRFIDGEYLRQIHCQAMLDFFGVEGELDIFEAKCGAGALTACRARGRVSASFLTLYDKRVIPGKPSNPESKVMICSIPWRSMTAMCTASRADSFRYPKTICFARSAMDRSTAST